MFSQKTLKYSGQLFEFTKDGLTSFFKIFMRKAFDVREGEIARVLLMQLNIFLLISTILILKPTVNSLFLSKLGADKLPVAFLLVAVFAIITSLVYSRKLKKMSLNKIISWTIVFSIGIFFLFWLLLRLDVLEGWVLYLFYIWVSIFAVLSASQFWILANIVFNAREAKRLFGFIGAGAIAGGIFGGYLTSVLVYIISSENLLLVSILLLSFCIPITKRIWKTNVANIKTPFIEKNNLNGFDDHPFKLIKKSKHLTYLASIICVSVIVAKLVDYQFSAIASHEITDPDSLTAFFGFWFSNMNLVSLFIQLFLTRKVVGVFGVGTSLFLLPIGILLGAVAIFFVPELWTAIFLRINEGSLKQSVNKAGVELLALPIPAEIKSQTKSFIDVVVDSIASGLGGIMLLVLVIGLGLSARFVSLLIILHVMVWFYLVVKIRREYIRLFLLKINHTKSDSNKNIPDLKNESVIGGLIKVLENGTEKQILYTLSKLKEIPNERFFEPLVQLLNNASENVRLEALRNVYFYRDKNITDEITKLINDPNQEIKTAAFDFLFKNLNLNFTQGIKPYLSNEDYRIRGAAILSLAIETRDNFSLKEEFKLEDIIKKYLDEINLIQDVEQELFLKLNTLKIIGWSNLPVFYGEINNSLLDTNPKIVKEAIKAAGLTLDLGFVNKLIEFLGDDDLKDAAILAILNYGLPIIDELLSIVKNKSIEIEKRRMLPSIIEKIGVQKSVNLMLELVDCEELVIRNEVIRALNNLKRNFPHLKFNKRYIVQKIFEEARIYNETLAVLYVEINADSGLNNLDENIHFTKKREARKSLINLLERRLDGNLERIFRLLGLRYFPDDMINVYNGIIGNKVDIRANAIEFMDNLLGANLKRVIIPIIETASLSTISEDAIINSKIKIHDEYECLANLLEGKDVKIKLAVLFLIGELRDPKYKSIIEKYITSDNLKIKTFATKALETI